MSALPDRDACVLPLSLQRRAKDEPDRPLIVFEDGSSWSAAQTDAHVLRTAAGLAELGVRQGDHVLSWLPNGSDAVRAWLGANQLGAVYVPVNTAFRGRSLEHVIGDSAARVAVVHASLVERLTDVDLGCLEHVVVLGGGASTSLAGVTVHAAAQLDNSGLDTLPPCPAMPWDPYAIIYTSGTTGPSKGVVCSYAQLWATATAVSYELGRDDRFLAHLPLFHAGGTIAVAGALALGGSVAVVPGFTTTTFWDLIRRTGTTAATVLGTMASWLLAQPVRPDDADTPLRSTFVIPLSVDAAVFGDRFGCRVLTCYNMTEVSVPLVSEERPRVLGTCGRPRPGVHARLVDEHDVEVPAGQVGELLVRTDVPWTLLSEYWQQPEATAHAWRNGWFHTGDAFRVDDNGNWFFVDRMKDAIRRRGENISSIEVESEVLAHPSVAEAAAVAVPSEHGEDDVLVVVAPAPGAALEPAELVAFLVPRMPHFAVPRYIRVLEELPKTPTAKVLKAQLRTEGLTPSTWDRDAAGISVKDSRIR
jgi:crotonobetaine/carnitine-CoA ligase